MPKKEVKDSPMIFKMGDIITWSFRGLHQKPANPITANVALETSIMMGTAMFRVAEIKSAGRFSPHPQLVSITNLSQEIMAIHTAPNIQPTFFSGSHFRLAPKGMKR